MPVISLPVMTTRATWPASTHAMNSLKLADVSLRWNLDEKFQTSTPTATRTIQNTRLFRVEFNLPPGGAAGSVASQIPRRVPAP